MADGSEVRQRDESWVGRCDILERNLRKLVFVRVADDRADARQRSYFLWGALGVAPGDDDFREGILALHAADGCSGILVCGICDSAGVKDYQVSLVQRGPGQAAGFELAFESGSVGLGGAAAETLYMERGHGTMVAQWWDVAFDPREKI